MSRVLKTGNANLQKYLENWVVMLDLCIHSCEASQKLERVKNFAVTFVPPDVRSVPEDLEYFVNNMINDDEYFQGVKRDITQCASGIYVESITPTPQTKKATFTLLPSPELSMLSFAL